MTDEKKDINTVEDGKDLEKDTEKNFDEPTK